MGIFFDVWKFLTYRLNFDKFVESASRLSNAGGKLLCQCSSLQCESSVSLVRNIPKATTVCDYYRICDLCALFILKALSKSMENNGSHPHVRLLSLNIVMFLFCFALGFFVVFFFSCFFLGCLVWFDFGFFCFCLFEFLCECSVLFCFSSLPFLGQP